MVNEISDPRKPVSQDVPEIPENPQQASNQGQENQPKQNQAPKMPKEIEIGFHQGAITTLANERNELLKMAQTVEIIMQSHVKRLEELGVKVTKKKAE